MSTKREQERGRQPTNKEKNISIVTNYHSNIQLTNSRIYGLHGFLATAI